MHRRPNRLLSGALGVLAFGSLIAVAPDASAADAADTAYAARLLDVLEGDEAPAPSRVEALADQLGGGASPADVVAGIVGDEPHRLDTLDRQYLEILGREGDPGGLAYWEGLLETGKSEYAVRSSFYASQEFVAGRSTSEYVAALYLSILEREADPAGLAHWTAQTTSDSFTSRFATALRIQQSVEARRLEAEEIYERILTRTPDTGGRDYFADRLLDRGILQVTAALAASGELVSSSQVDESAYVLLADNTVAVVDPETLAPIGSATTYAPTGATAQLGITPGTSLVAIDVRPFTGVLYGLGSDGQLYSLGANGTAAKIGAPIVALAGASVGMDFNPVVDRLRFVTAAGANLRVNPDTGAVASADTDVAFAPGDRSAGATPSVGAVAYTNSAVSATLPATTTLFDVDATTDALVTQNPPNDGVLNTVGSLGYDATASATFDISPATGRAWLVDGGTTYRVDLASGRAMPQATGGPTVLGMALLGATPAATGEALVLSSVADVHSLTVLDLDAPGTAVQTFTVTGVNAGTTLLGIDVRGATGIPYVLGSDGQLYALGAPKATTPTVLPAEKASAAPTVTAFTGAVGFDFNPAVDRIRFVSATSSRVLNPNNGAETIGAATNYAAGDPFFGEVPNIRSAAYTNDLRGGVAASTALFDLDSTQDVLVTQNVTTGALTTVGALGADITDDGGFDILRGSGAAYTVQLGALHAVDLTTGAITTIGAIPAGLTVTGFALR